MNLYEDFPMQWVSIVFVALNISMLCMFKYINDLHNRINKIEEVIDDIDDKMLRLGV